MKPITRKQFFKHALAGIAGLGAVAMGKDEAEDRVKVTVVDEPLFGDPTLKEWEDLTLNEHQELFDKVMNFKVSGINQWGNPVEEILDVPNQPERVFTRYIYDRPT